MGVEERIREIGGRGDIADGISMYRRLVEVMKPQSARVDPEFRAKAQLAQPVADLEGSVVAPGFVAEVGDASCVSSREYEGLLGED